jgi:hypothetical protein
MTPTLRNIDFKHNRSRSTSLSAATPTVRSIRAEEVDVDQAD